MKERGTDPILLPTVDLARKKSTMKRKDQKTMLGEPIKDWTGKILGYVETDLNGNKTLRDFHGRILGRYNKGLNVTQDFYGRRVGMGDILLTLLR